MNKQAFAVEVKKQLGGNKFLEMTGARVHHYEEDMVIFKLKENKIGANAMKITKLEGKSDEVKYDMVFEKWNYKTFEKKIVARSVGLAPYDLRLAFLSITGINTEL